jgi:adenine-specific DNA methylase
VIPKECKRLAEVDFPIAVVSAHAAREKAIRHGLPSTLHLWWARRPLASSRAVLLALLLPDPCDPNCPETFKKAAREVVSEVRQSPKTDEDLQKALLWFIGSFASWDLASNRTYLRVARELVKAAHPEEPPLVVDPFAGGGSIPLEALRLGCEAFASDLNPVACLILKVMLEDIPRLGPQLAEDVSTVGAKIRRDAQKDLADLFPKDPDGAVPIAYLWARTVRCESSKCGAEIPLIRSLWLCTKGSRRRALRLRIERPKGQPPRVEFEVFEPKVEKDVHSGTVTRAKATCGCCGVVLLPERVRAQLADQRGGADVIFDAAGGRSGGARLLAVATLHPGETGRQYRLPTDRDYESVRKAQVRIANLLEQWERGGRQGSCPVPDEQLPPIGTLGFRVQRYGMLRWGDLFTARQKVSMRELALATAGAKAVDTDVSMLALGKLVDLGNALCAWMPGQECPSAVFKLGRVKMAWDFVEGCPLGESSGSYEKCTENMAAGVAATDVGVRRSGQVTQGMAQESPLPDESAAVWFTDPPYYDAIPYADLSDLFLVWLKRITPSHRLLKDPFDPANPLSPKDQEAVQDDTRRVNGRPKDARFFDEAMGAAFAEGKRVLREDGIGGVVFAHKTTEGWEALLSGMIRGGWTISSSWPIATEMAHRIRARESAALSTSVHLICRPRPEDAGVGDWAGVLRELPTRVGEWMERLQGEGVRGADLVFACIGPALEIFSRYARVESAEGREVKLDEYLAKVWEVVGRSALGQVLGTAEARARNGAAGAVEEDARLTALFLWTLQATEGEGIETASGANEEYDLGDEDDEEEGASRTNTKGFTLVYDVVRRFAQPLGIDLPKWEGRVIETKKGVVRLLPIAERAKQLFGEEGASAVAVRLEQTAALGTNPLQGMLFPEMEAPPKVRGARGRGRRASIDVSDESLAAAREATTLDRVHAAMLLQAGGRTNALRALLRAEQDRGPDFLRLANALSALYPNGSEEKRLLDAMLLAVPR